MIFEGMTLDYITVMVYEQLDGSCLFEGYCQHFLATNGCNRLLVKGKKFIINAKIT